MKHLDNQSSKKKQPVQRSCSIVLGNQKKSFIKRGTTMNPLTMQRDGSIETSREGLSGGVTDSFSRDSSLSRDSYASVEDIE